jgi:hypothetical protein
MECNSAAAGKAKADEGKKQYCSSGIKEDQAKCGYLRETSQ